MRFNNSSLLLMTNTFAPSVKQHLYKGLIVEETPPCHPFIKLITSVSTCIITVQVPFVVIELPVFFKAGINVKKLILQLFHRYSIFNFSNSFSVHYLPFLTSQSKLLQGILLCNKSYLNCVVFTASQTPLPPTDLLILVNPK
jgi:hypothetical protein